MTKQELIDKVIAIADEQCVKGNEELSDKLFALAIDIRECVENIESHYEAIIDYQY